MNLIIELELHKGKTWPVIVVNNRQYSFEFTETIGVAEIECDCQSIRLSNVNKTDSETIIDDGKIVQDQYIKILSFYYDNIQLDKDIIINNSSFFPKYHESFLTYANENKLPVDYIIITDSFYFNGDWIFNTQSEFWPWYADQLNKKLCMSMSREQIEKYIGVPTEHAISSLTLLKHTLDEV
jgi:hypothetical protein